MALCSAWQSRGTAPGTVPALALVFFFHWPKHRLRPGFAMRRGWPLPSVACNAVPGCRLLSPCECFPWQCPAPPGGTRGEELALVRVPASPCPHENCGG